jgi:hypothetical protein
VKKKKKRPLEISLDGYNKENYICTGDLFFGEAFIEK